MAYDDGGLDEYGQRNADGSVSVIHKNADGSYVERRRDASWAQNQGNQWNTGSPAAMNVAAGSNFLPYQLQALDAAAQQDYLRRKLDELDIPMSRAEREQIIAQITGYYMPGASAKTMSNTEALDYITGTRPKSFWDFYKANGWNVDSTEGKRRAVQDWIGGADPQWKGMTAQQVAEKLGAQTGGGFAGAYAGQAGALPTWAREQAEKLAEAQRRQFGLNLLSSKTGPEDYWTYRQMLPEVFGEVQPGRSFEQMFLDYWNAYQQGTSPAAPPGQGPQGTVRPPDASIQPVPGIERLPARPIQVPFEQPHNITPQQWNQRGPTGQKMTGGAWSYWGQDPNDMYRQMQAAWPTGQAAQQTLWGR